LGIGAPDDRRKGYGREALGMLLEFAFAELNLYRLSAMIPEYNPAALALFQEYGFTQEACRRSALGREGKRWNLYHYGLLTDEWQARGVQ
jgi:RimJ/RimL family protein N-acetyltransferase